MSGDMMRSYILTYGLKLKTEGRWLNFLSFNILKLIPPYLSILFIFCSFLFYLYLCSKYNSKKKCCPIFALYSTNFAYLFSRGLAVDAAS